MNITEHGNRQGKGRPPIAEAPLPPNIQKALSLRSGGAMWKDEAAGANMEYETLRRKVLRL